MPSSLLTFVQTIIGPLAEVRSHVSQLAAVCEDANKQWYSHTTDLHSSDSFNVFIGNGARAFFDRSSYDLHIWERHVQVLNDVANAILICESDTMDATDIALQAHLHGGLLDKIFTKVSPDDIIQNGRGAIEEVINNMMSILDEVKSSGDFLGHPFFPHFRDTFGDLGQEFNNAEHLVLYTTNQLQNIRSVLGQWASTVSDSVDTCLKFIQSIDVVDFVSDFSDIINNGKRDFGPETSLLLAQIFAILTLEQRAHEKVNKDYFEKYGI
jgi:hypothetical protein